MDFQELYTAGGQEAHRLFLGIIKQGTADLHTALEAHPYMAVLMDPGVLTKDYCTYLSIMGEVHRVFEAVVLPGLTNFPYRLIPVGQVIKRDIEQLDCPEQGQRISFNLDLPSTSTSFLLGFAYVMEGSKLGGKVILKHINRHLGFDEETGAAYLAGNGSSTGASWKDFLQHFSHYVLLNRGAEDAVSGARFAFSSIFNFLEKNQLVNEH
ncbi:hypothetical protein EXU57_10655 [Segetibacter sp. 3557_3]|uniref:biliverdin-producing heme oxygenase n=1 Tax=Segetibacter sp. 3557_3 TaxID=2547429 RepID=UPI001058BD44|nr:biliverdin-producing heme oxygenase [Segetibacter sp. 3557_3]TDH26543.1 hypothetical protein EXU57_10655 [Segetibacter sp. 3557_3]